MISSRQDNDLEAVARDRAKRKNGREEPKPPYDA